MRNGEVPASVDETSEPAKRENPEPAMSHVGANNDSRRKNDRKKRVAITTPAVPDIPARSFVYRIPVASIVSHRFLAIVIAVAVMIAVLAGIGVLKMPAVPGSGNTGNLIATTGEETVAADNTTAIHDTEQTPILQTTPPSVSLTPGPTQVPPDRFKVYFQAERDPTTRIVSVQFMGGQGQAGVRDVLVRLTRSDGQVLTGTFKPIQAGSGVDLQGTDKVDRVEVIAHYYTGDTYTIIDQTFEWKKQL